jgi:hypothetical protein
LTRSNEQSEQHFWTKNLGKLMTVAQVANFLGIMVEEVFALVAVREIPYQHEQGKYFFKTYEIERYKKEITTKERILFVMPDEKNRVKLVPHGVPTHAVHRLTLDQFKAHGLKLYDFVKFQKPAAGQVTIQRIPYSFEGVQ